jgi:hypothetical protein
MTLGAFTNPKIHVNFIIHRHCGPSQVQINVWLTPDASLEDPAGTHSGLVVFDASPPEDWTFEDYNK